MNTKITFREKGQGPILLCLHGYAGSVFHWEQVSLELQKNFRVVVPNLTHLMMGQQNFTFTEQVNLIAGFIKEQFPQKKIFLTGISFGGSLAWGLAILHSELVEKIVLINPMPPFADKYFALSTLKYFFYLPLPRTLIYFFLNSPFGKPFLKTAAGVFRNLREEPDLARIESLNARKLQLMSHVLWKFSWILNNENWHLWELKLKKWKQECLLIYDREDPLFTPSFYDSFAQLLTSTNVVSTQHAGHISIIQESKLISGAIREYLLRDFFQQAAGYN